MLLGAIVDVLEFNTQHSVRAAFITILKYNYIVVKLITDNWKI